MAALVDNTLLLIVEDTQVNAELTTVANIDTMVPQY